MSEPQDTGDPPRPSVRLIFDAAEQELWINDAIRFMIAVHGRPLDMESEEQRDAWHSRLGLLVHFISWERSESR